MGKAPKVMGIYAGIGSPFIGFEAEGYEIIANLEPREFANAKTFVYNFPRADFYPNLGEYDYKPDIIIGHPDCKSYSALNTKEQKEFSPETIKEEAFFKACKIAEKYNPPFVIFENVPRILKHMTFLKKGMFFDLAPDDILLEDYYIQREELSPEYFNTAQRRRRVFFIAKKFPENIFIKRWPRTRKTVADEIIKNPVYGLPNQIPSKHSEKRIEGFEALKPGESYYNSQNNQRLDPDRIAGVITSSSSRFVHPTEPRTLTVRECARLMGFPDDFEFFGGMTNQLDQVGKAISPTVARGLAYSLKKHIKEHGIVR